MEAVASEDLVINFSQVFDHDQTIFNTWDCETICGKSCDYLNAGGFPRKVTAVFADGENNDTVNRSLTIAKDQLEESKIYSITIHSKYK